MAGANTRRECPARMRSQSSPSRPPPPLCDFAHLSVYYRGVAIDVEVNLRIPSLTVRPVGKPNQRIDNGAVRFSKRITVNAVPKPGESLSVSAQSGEPFECSVTRSDWSEEKNLFIVSCTYARRSITSEEYEDLVSDPAWVKKQLP